MMRLFRTNPFWMLLVLLATATFARAAERSEALLRLVGEDVGLCVELSDFKRELPTFLNSELASRLKGLKLYQDWLESTDHQKLVKSREGIEQFAGKPFDQMMYELFGKSVVVAIYPLPDGATKAVILTQAADSKTLDWSLETWNRQKSITTETLEHGGWKYTRRVRQGHKSSPVPQLLYYVRFDETYALSDHEPTIKRVIDLHLAKKASQESKKPTEAGKSLFDSERFQRSQRDLAASSLVRIYFNPQACHSSANLFSGNDHDPLRGMASAAWQRCESIGAGLRYDDGLVLELNLNYDSKGVPEEWARTLEVTKGRPDFFSRVPRDASVAAAGRFDPARFAKLLSSALGDPQQGNWSGTLQIARGLLLGRDPLNEVLASLGNNWTFYLVPRKVTGAKELPADALFAVELPADAALRGALDNALNTGLNYYAARRNGKSPTPPAIVRTKESGPAKTRWIEHYGDFEPTGALTADALVVATSPALVDRFISSATDDKLAASPFYQKLASRYVSDESQLMLVNVAAVRNFVKQHAALFVGDVAKKPSVSGDAAAKRDDANVVEILQLFDAAFLAGRLDENRVRLVAGAVMLPAAEETASTSVGRRR